MGKINFKCKGFLLGGKPCDKIVYAKMHTGVANVVSRQVKQIVIDVEGLKIDKIDGDVIPDLPSDWVFSLKCSRGHDEDYSYDEKI